MPTDTTTDTTRTATNTTDGPLPSLTDDAAALVALGERWDRRWYEQASCEGADEDLFFPARSVNPTIAITDYCTRCPVRLDCLAHGVKQARMPGVLGGRSRNQRKLLARMIGMASTGDHCDTDAESSR